MPTSDTDRWIAEVRARHHEFTDANAATCCTCGNRGPCNVPRLLDLLDAQREYMLNIACILRTSPRQGVLGADEPEGTRFITMSDTLASTIALRLEALAALDAARGGAQQ